MKIRVTSAHGEVRLETEQHLLPSTIKELVTHCRLELERMGEHTPLPETDLEFGHHARATLMAEDLENLRKINGIPPLVEGV